VETKTFWYNGTPLNQAYYNWMTAAAATADDLEFIYPGDQYLKHSGEVYPWPVDSIGRNTAMYKNNNFGRAKSKHVVGEYQDFFGGYYHDRKFGFGHWAPYEEMPGQKLWLWSLSRFGGIWEDLLTDTDGQYMEYQAGRLFNQYFPSAINPISQAHFDPYVMDRWRELWFPFKEIGGMVDASEHGVLNVKDENGSVYVAFNALQKLDQEIEVVIDGKKVLSEKLNLGPMEIFSKTFPGNASQTEVRVHNTELHYTGNVKDYRIKRPFEHDSEIELSEAEQLYTDGWEAMKYRDYGKAREKLSQLLALDPYHQDGLIKMAELEFRRTQFEKALEHANTVLKIDTYNPGGNYFAGIVYRALGDDINALESLGWAARDIEYRTAAFTEMAEIYAASKNYGRAKIYADKALDFNTYNLNARYVAALAAKENNESEALDNELEKILEIDPLNHFAHLEKAYADSPEAVRKIIGTIDNEFPEETVLELALLYRSLGFSDTALNILAHRSKTVKNKLWMAYLLRNGDTSKSTVLLNEAVGAPTKFVFPYRRETLPVLEWATEKIDHWKFDYYLAQNYLAVGLEDKGKKLLETIGDTPDSDVFYRFRAEMLEDNSYAKKLKDYQKALELNPSDWRVWEEHIQFYLRNKKYDEAYALSKKAYKKYPDNYSIGLSHSKALVNTGRHAETLKVLKKVRILPYEHAKESREVYERAHMALALENFEKGNYKKSVEILKNSKEWPENIGVGKPYGPDEREQDFMLALALEKNGKKAESDALLTEVAEYTEKHVSSNTLNHIYGPLALEKLGRNAQRTELMEKLRASAPPNYTKSLLALAFLKENKSRLEQFKSENIVHEDVWETAEWAAER
jgi:tetratricopeptide (TPR) repeat protein